MTTPEARARLIKGHDCWLWVVDHCPLCGRQHAHGGGALDGDPRQLLGHRLAHCQEGSTEPQGYILVEVGAGRQDTGAGYTART